MDNDRAIGCGCTALIALAIAVSEAIEFMHQNPIPAALILFLVILVIIMVASHSQPLRYENLTNAPVKNYQNLPKLEYPAGYVYVIKDSKYHKYKIGRTINPKSRLRDIQRNEVGQLEYIYLVRTDDAKSTEKNFHERYAQFRIRKDREWFELGQSQLQDIRNLVSPKQSERRVSSIWAGVSASLLLSASIVIGITVFFPSTPSSQQATKVNTQQATKHPHHAPRYYTKHPTATRTATATPYNTNTAFATQTASPKPTLIVTNSTALNIRFFQDGSSGARVRSCPGITDCSVIGGLKSGSVIQALEKTIGEEVHGSKIWFRFVFNDSPGFVHSSTVTEE